MPVTVDGHWRRVLMNGLVLAGGGVVMATVIVGLVYGFVSLFHWIAE